jgi:hypothetical protein
VSGTLVIIVHHCMVSLVSLQTAGSKSGCTIQAATSPQLRFVYLHSANRWWADSICHRQRTSLCGHLREASLSADQTRFCVMSHAKSQMILDST